jgi:hypothetical protein
MSNILYYLKEKNENLILKIEGAKCLDPTSKVQYFTPSDCAIELQDMQPDEIKLLIDTLKTMGQYDVIIVDMNSYFDEKTLEVFNECDKIVGICTQDLIGMFKFKCYLKELMAFLKLEKISLRDKLQITVNKYNHEMPIDFIDVNGMAYGDLVKIPFDQSLSVCKDFKDPLCFDNNFTRGVEQMLNAII